MWANAVILKDESKTFRNNDVIPEEDIESYFVGYQDTVIRYSMTRSTQV